MRRSRCRSPPRHRGGMLPWHGELVAIAQWVSGQRRTESRAVNLSCRNAAADQYGLAQQRFWPCALASVADGSVDVVSVMRDGTAVVGRPLRPTELRAGWFDASGDGARLPANASSVRLHGKLAG